MAPRFIPIKDRILRASRIDENGCWIWTKKRFADGYGQMTICADSVKKSKCAHRVAYEAWKGAIPTGLEIDHLCRVRPCVNPDHLEPVTHKENMHRSPYFATRWRTAAA